MRTGKPSGTSTMVAFWRGLNAYGVTRVRDFSDPFAVQLLPRWPARLLRGIGWAAERRPHVVEEFLKGSKGMFDVVALRSKAIDAVWEEAANAGVQQLVILGAGLDARAYRLPRLARVRVFEVDHPWTQAFKRRQAEKLHSPAASLTYVPVDFAHDDLREALRAAGLRTDERAVWIWEGVTHYLPYRATVETLNAVASLTPAGSRLVATYGEPGPSNRASRVRGVTLRLLREPHVGLMSRDQMARFLAQGGWKVLSDEGLDDIARRFGGGASEAASLVRERVVVAERV